MSKLTWDLTEYKQEVVETGLVEPATDEATRDICEHYGYRFPRHDEAWGEYPAFMKIRRWVKRELLA